MRDILEEAKDEEDEDEEEEDQKEESYKKAIREAWEEHDTQMEQLQQE